MDTKRGVRRELLENLLTFFSPFPPSPLMTTDDNDTTPTRPTRAMVVCSLFRGEGRRVPNGSPSAQRTSASARRPPGRTFGGSPFEPATRRRLRMTYWRRQKFPTDFPVSHH